MKKENAELLRQMAEAKRELDRQKALLAQQEKVVDGLKAKIDKNVIPSLEKVKSGTVIVTTIGDKIIVTHPSEKSIKLEDTTPAGTITIVKTKKGTGESIEYDLDYLQQYAKEAFPDLIKPAAVDPKKLDDALKSGVVSKRVYDGCRTVTPVEKTVAWKIDFEDARVLN